MFKLLLASSALATVLVLSQPTKAAIIADLGVNPASAQGDFSNSVGGGAFKDQFTFQLAGGPLHITIANVTNVFPAPTDFITNFTAGVWSVGLDGIVNNADDVPVLGPVAATQGCGPIANCQFAAGTAILNQRRLLPRIHRYRRRHVGLWRQHRDLCRAQPGARWRSTGLASAEYGDGGAHVRWLRKPLVSPALTEVKTGGASVSASATVAGISIGSSDQCVGKRNLSLAGDPPGTVLDWPASTVSPR